MKESRRIITVAAIQMKIVSLDIATNLKTAERLLEEALERQSLDLVVFPEDCITGPIPANPELVLHEDHDAIRFFKDLAKKHSLYIVCGSFIRKKGDRLFNTALLIDPFGDIILEYDKNNLWHPERSILSKGSTLPVVETSIGTIGVMICWDLTAPEICRELARKGADIICCPSYWMNEVSGSLYQIYPHATPDVTVIDALCPARAIENGVLLIYANNGEMAEIYLEHETLHLEPVGHSQIACPILGTVARLDHGHEGSIVYTYDRTIADAAEKQYKFREDSAMYRA